MNKFEEEISRLLLFYDSGELSEGEKARVDKALAESPMLREELEKIRALMRGIKQAPSFEPPAEMMNGLRHDLRVQLRRERLRPSIGERFEEWFSGAQAWLQLAGAAALVIIGIAVDRTFLITPTKPSGGAAELLQQIAAAQPVAAENGSVSPLMAGVEYIRIDPQTEQVEIHYNLVNDIQLRGSADDPAIRRVLAYALTQNDRPNVRLKAVKALAEKPIADDDVISALLHALQNDDNEGIRLKAAQVLRGAPISDKIKNALSLVLLRDHNAAVRMEALESLEKTSLTENEIAALRAAAADTNDYVRMQAKQLIERRENPQTTPANTKKN
jgi:HEAT repeat protein